MNSLYKIAMEYDTKFRAIKDTLKKLCLVFLVASMCHGGQTYASPIKEAQYISDKMIVEIARKTLDGKQLRGRLAGINLRKEA